MSLSWPKRVARLKTLLDYLGDEDERGLALDRLLHGQSVIGKTSKTTEIDALRFQDSDLQVLGALESGQFGLIHVVNCTVNGHVYVRKSTRKAVAFRFREQCSPQLERDILLQALRTDTPWAPHLFCAYQTTTHLNLVMEYIDGGSLWDVLESSPLDGRITEKDIMWWCPQIVSAVHWCHTQGFVHRDIKPHNFVFTPSAHLRLIDFGSAAPLLPPEPDGSRLLPRKYCLVPCGTCDYISPEILHAHERALVALELEAENQPPPAQDERDIYGLETDWWSTGSMLYEMVYGFAPFFAQDVQKTYLKIMDHSRSLRFNPAIPISSGCQDLLRRFLTDAEFRLGRKSFGEITNHSLFTDIDWDNLTRQPAPLDLHLPQFTYSGPPAESLPEASRADNTTDTQTQGAIFSALFQSSPISAIQLAPVSATPSPNPLSVHIGFSWGPTLGDVTVGLSPSLRTESTPRTRFPTTPLQPSSLSPSPQLTPVRPNLVTPHGTLPRNARHISEREAMKQLVDCVGQSARKKVLESGRKPRILNAFNKPRSGSSNKEIRFVPAPINLPPKGSRLLPKSTTTFELPPSETSDTDSDLPVSPSPSPRPGSAMSLLSRRSATPTLTSTTFSQRLSVLTTPSNHSALREPIRSTVLSLSLEDSTLDALEAKHVSIMYNIQDIERRIARLKPD